MTNRNRYRFLKRKLAAMLTLCMLSTLLFSSGAAQAVAVVTPVPVLAPPVLLSPTDLLITQDTTPELWLQAASGHEIIVKDANGAELARAHGQGKQKVSMTLPSLESKLHWLRLSTVLSSMTSEELRVPVYVDSDGVFNVQDVVRILRQSEQIAGFDYGSGGVSGFMRELLSRTNPKSAPEFGWAGFAGVDEVFVQVDHTKGYIEVVVPFGTNLASLQSEFSVPAGVTARVGGVLQTSGSTANDFNRPVFYEVSDGSLKARYAVNVIVEPGMHAFGFVNTTPQVMGTIDETTHTIDVVVPYGTSLNGLIAGYEVSPGTAVTVDGDVQIPGLTANDFSEPIVYTLIRDGRTVTYAVNVTEGAAPEEAPEMFYFGIVVNGEPIAGTIHGNQIEVTVPYGTDLEDLLVSFEVTGNAVVTVNGEVQYSYDSSQDFTSPVTYVVTLGGAETTYEVHVMVDEPGEEPTETPEMYYFAVHVDGVPIAGTIHENEIEVTVPYGTELDDLLVSFEVTGDAVVTVNGEVQYSYDSSQNFTDPVTYVVTLGNSVSTYVVNVTVDEPTGDPVFKAFGILVDNTTVAGTVYVNNTIEVYVPYGTDPANLVAVFDTPPYAAVTVGGEPQDNGVTVNNFSTDVVYTVTLGTKSANYTVTVAVLPGNAPSCTGPLCDLTAWTLGATGGLWNALPFDSGLANGAFGTLSTTRPGDTSNGALPARPAGSTSTHALWYGKSSTGEEGEEGEEPMEIGNYLNVWNGSTNMNGGSSSGSHQGSILSPTFTVGSQAGYKPYLTFNAWWEIEGQDPISFDQMEVYAVTADEERFELGTLNDTIQEEENLAATPQTSGGLGAAPIWVEYRYDLSQFEGEAIRIELRFRTVDSSYNAFRGWLVTDVQTKMVSVAAMMPPLGEGGGRESNPELPPIRVE
jgi:sulfur carrier protein ThiS